MWIDSMAESTDLIYKTTAMRTYGLSGRWIKRMGAPDKVVPNPHRKALQSALYSRARIEAFLDEHRAEYEAYQAQRAKRSARMSAIAQAKREQLMTWATEAAIETRPIPHQWKTLLDMVWESGHNSHNTFTMSPNAVLAYPRHSHTNYHALLAQIEAQVGCNEAYMIIRQRVDAVTEAAITERFKTAWARYMESGDTGLKAPRYQ